MKRRALCIRHVAFEGLGTFDSVLTAHGYDIDYIDATRGELREQRLGEDDLLVVCGAPFGVYDEVAFPFISEERRLVGEALANGNPLLGICFGAQLIASVLGAEVYPAPRKEIGWLPLNVPGDNLPQYAAPLFGTRGPVFQLHGDTFDLPRGGVCLASTDVCQNQAFVHGNALGLQFHLEVSAHDLETWYAGHAHELASNEIDIPVLRSQSAQYGPALEHRAQQFLDGWLNSVEAASC